jgi:glycosyltransferase involved in cell wall biosynthesis
MPSSDTASSPLISVVVPTCDRRVKTLRCVESLLAQDVDGFEVIVVDDGSRDGTADAIAAIDDPRLSVLRNERNIGANASRNRGARHARSNLVVFLDSDCTADPHCLSSYLPAFEDREVGAASGLVEDTPPRNVWELLFRGTHRFGVPGPISRICSANVCIRRSLLIAHEMEEDFSDNAVDADGVVDTSFSGRCDEEGLYLAIRRAGWSVVAHPDSKVDHDHPYDRRSLCKQAFHGGGAAAELVWKFRLRDRLDLLPLIAFWISLVPALALAASFSGWFLLLPLPFLLLQAAAVSYNELARKGKTIMQLMRIGPALVLYYHLRLAGYVIRRSQLLVGIRPIVRIDPVTFASEMPRPPAEVQSS